MTSRGLVTDINLSITSNFTVIKLLFTNDFFLHEHLIFAIIQTSFVIILKI